jgi:hypothetical protein
MSAPAEKHHAKKPLQMGSHPHMRAKPLKTRGLILSLSKDEAKISGFFSSPFSPLVIRPRSDREAKPRQTN